MKSLPPFARVIKEQRDRLQMSRTQLAEASDLSYPYISQLETGLRKPSRNAARAIAGALGISVEDLERTIPINAASVEDMQQAEAFSNSLLSGGQARSLALSVDIVAGSASDDASSPGSREDLVGDILDLLEEFDASERLDVLAEVQKRAMQRMIDDRER